MIDLVSKRTFLFLAAVLAVCALASAPDAQTAQGKVLLTVELAADPATGQPRTTEFDMAMLDALPQESFQTTTIWTDGVISFSGPALSTLLNSLDSPPVTLTAYALNDYSIAIAEVAQDAPYPIIATRMNGAPYSVREGGPLWLVFPYDSDEKYQQETIYSQSIWQLIRLKAE
ncbi:oxidoreductase [uncultured Lentibacter sp.]|jgi:hypothetical protein|uniref:oxidoreductase n=1 Tax=uncultured Lentibacter sp. TaxID=1659309 RepID=UPI00261F8C10|nr:oxidoreductase [uncultured Lentibacter sp.]